MSEQVYCDRCQIWMKSGETCGDSRCVLSSPTYLENMPYWYKRNTDPEGMVAAANRFLEQLIEESEYIEYPILEEPMTALDQQVGGDHYKSQNIQPIQYIFENDLGFCEGNVVKYVTRYKDKNGIQDLKKARHYLDMLIERLEGEECPF